MPRPLFHGSGSGPASGSQNQNVAPWPGAESTLISPPWRRIPLADALRAHAGIDLERNPSRDELLEAAARSSVGVQRDATAGTIVEDLFSALVEPHLIQPTCGYDYPGDFPGSLLAKRSPDNPHLTERFEMFVGGMEIANAFTELNDPFDQRERMEEAARLRGDEHQDVDADYILALEYGMPPTGGLGFGIDRLTMFLAGARHIREAILFPLLRPRENADVEP